MFSLLAGQGARSGGREPGAESKTASGAAPLFVLSRLPVARVLAGVHQTDHRLGSKSGIGPLIIDKPSAVIAAPRCFAQHLDRDCSIGLGPAQPASVSSPGKRAFSCSRRNSVLSRAHPGRVDKSRGQELHQRAHLWQHELAARLHHIDAQFDGAPVLQHLHKPTIREFVSDEEGRLQENARAPHRGGNASVTVVGPHARRHFDTDLPVGPVELPVVLHRKQAVADYVMRGQVRRMQRRAALAQVGW